jgi:hypothetical protein
VRIMAGRAPDVRLPATVEVGLVAFDTAHGAMNNQHLSMSP